VTRQLSDYSWTEIPERPVILIPLGSCEQHGPHLPLDTDTCIATHVALAAASHLRAANVPALVAPGLPYGASGEHADFPGTLSLGTAVLAAVLTELCRSADWCTRVIFVNGHGGNVDGLVHAVSVLRAEGRDVAWFSCQNRGGDAHAGRTETSAMLALAPHRVSAEPWQIGETLPLEDLICRLRAEGVRDVSRSGILGDPTGANSDEGRRTLEGMAHDLVTAIERGELSPHRQV